MPISTHSNELEETLLFSRLKESKFPCQKSELNELLSKILKKYYDEAVQYMGKVESIFKEYTLHDKTHILNVIDIMGRIIPHETLEKLNCLEVFFLILSACFHDIGMYLEEDEMADLKSSKKFQKSLYKFAQYKSNLAKLKNQKEKINLDKNQIAEINKNIDLLEEIHLINFLREAHGDRAANFLISNYQENKDFIIDNISIIPTLSKVCQSHTKSLYEIDVNHDELISTFQVNSMYLCLILRLADILDFDRTRTPPELLDNIQSTRSLEEWKKHLSVLGVNISQDKIIYQCECEKPKYQLIINKFLDTIEQEIVQCREKCNSFPHDFAYYKLNLPLKIDRSKIKPKDDKYIYRELFIQLNKEQVITLFMGLHTYNHPSLCIRELAQNSIDALTFRRSLYQYYNSREPKLEINFKHVLQEDGTEVLICKDTGVGMDLDDINGFLLISGNSYYHSFDFNRWKTKFNEKEIKCETIAKWGIGFFSCFMIGDHIKVSTRKDLGPIKGLGEPFIIHIYSAQEIITISKGDEDQEVGTQIEILKREREIYHHPDWDKIKLERTLNEFFVKTEYPINIEVTVPNLEVKKTLLPNFIIFPTKLEQCYKKIKTYTFDYKNIHSKLEGGIRTSFLTDKDGNITIKNEEAEIEIDTHEIRGVDRIDPAFRTCFNGIVVNGERGRERIGFGREGDNLFVYPFSSATLNVIGDLQAPLNLNRTGYKVSRHDPKWRRLRDLAFKAYYKLWEEIIEIEKIEDPEELWIFFIIYQVDVVSLSNDKVLELPFPFIKNGDVKWLKLGDIKEIKLISYQGNWTYQIENGYILKPTKKIISWLNFLELNFLRYIITKFIKIDFNKTDQFPEVSLNLETLPTNEYKPEYGRFYVVPFNKNSILTLEWIQYDSGRYWGVFNSNHSISEIVSRISYKPYENLSDKEKFCQSIVSLLRAPWFYSYYKNKKKPTNNMKYIAHLYVHLINIEKDLENIIPFNVFIKDIGIIEVNDKLLRSWL